MDNMDELFDDIQLSQSDIEIADISELLNTHGDLFDEDIDADDIDIEMANISELLHMNPNIFEVSDLTI